MTFHWFLGKFSSRAGGTRNVSSLPTTTGMKTYSTHDSFPYSCIYSSHCITDHRLRIKLCLCVRLMLHSISLLPPLPFPHLLSCYVHVPDDDASIRAAGDELTSVWGVAQALDFVTVGSARTYTQILHNKLIKHWIKQCRAGRVVAQHINMNTNSLCEECRLVFATYFKKGSNNRFLFYLDREVVLLL